MVLSPRSIVKLSVVAMGAEREKGSAIHARKNIQKNQTIYELIGMMPHDNDTANTHLSEITPVPGQDQSLGELRILFGPIRFVNHLCRDFNAAVCSPIL